MTNVRKFPSAMRRISISTRHAKSRTCSRCFGHHHSRPCMALLSLALLSIIGLAIAGCANNTRQIAEAEYAAREAEELAKLARPGGGAVANGNSAHTTPGQSLPDQSQSAQSNPATPKKQRDIDPIQQSWRVGIVPHPITNTGTCAVLAPVKRIWYGDVDAILQLIISLEAVFLQSDSSYNSTTTAQLIVDNENPLRFDALANEQTLLMEKNYETLVAQLLSGRYLNVNVSFELQRDTPLLHSFDYDLSVFRKAFRSMGQCQ